jgi:hypothetical protein
MKKYLLIFPIFTILLFSCKKDKTEEGFTYLPMALPDSIEEGYTIALRNGQTWEAGGRAVRLTPDSLMTFQFSTVDSIGSEWEGLGIVYIPVKQGRFPVFNSIGHPNEIIVGSAYSLTNDDLVSDYYQLDECFDDNFVLINKLDRVAHTVQGTYNLHFKQVKGPDFYPNEIHFSDGYFDLKIVN